MAPRTRRRPFVSLVFQWLLLLVCLPWFVVSSNKNSSSSSSIDDVSIQESLVRWIRQEGGFFNDKQEFRRAIPGDPSSPFGIFVASPIPEGEVLVRIPWKNVLTAGLDEFDTGLHCHTIRLLFDEMTRVGQQEGHDTTTTTTTSSSDFLPYIQYLQSLPPVDIPSTWSKAARGLLERMLSRGTALPPKYATTWVSHDWLRDCEGSSNSAEQIQAAMLVLTRGDDDVLIPIYDLYNHRNGKWFNTRANVVEHVKYELTASRDLQTGEEIYNSYNHCTQCYNRHLNYGTAEIFRDYGFVEQYPQRWIFAKHHIAFDLDVNEEEDGTLELVFLEDPPFHDTFRVTQEALDFLQQQSNRLQQFYKESLEPLLLLQETSSSSSSTSTEKDDDATIKPSELESIVQYYEALSRALQMAVQAGKDYDFTVNDDSDDDDDDDDDEEEIVVVPPNDISLQQGVVDWLRINGGIFHRNQEIRRERPGDPSSLIGVFAKEDIDEGETLLLVPSELVLQPAKDPDYQAFFCDSAQFIAREMKLGQDSFFAPYIRYLLAAPPVSIPSTWSSQGQQLFLQVTDHGKLPPDDAIQWVSKWKRDCKITNDEDPLEKQAAMLLLTRGDDDALTPVYDMYNHRNGPYFNNARSYLEHDRIHAIVAHRNIQKGEQIYLSYNHCLQCDNRYYSYGTPELLRDYGFVESFPQRWIFNMEPKIAFDIVESPPNKDLELIWLDGSVNETTFGELYQVTQQGVDALESQLQRLLVLYDKVLQPLVNNDNQSTTIPKNELDTILRYYESLVRALDMAVKAHKTYDYDSNAGALDVDKEGDVQEVVTVRKTNDLDDEDDNDDDDDAEEEDDDDDEDDEWSTDGDCPGGLYVKGRCVTDIKKWEEL
jgi:hypothetical protein